MQATIENTLEDVKNRFEQWRKTKAHRDRIPEELWDAAVGLTSAYPLALIVKILHLDFKDLKERMRKNGTQPEAQPQKSVAHAADASKALFMEVPLSAISSYVPGQLECDCLEIVRTDGAKMRLQAGSFGRFDVKTLIDAFLGGNHAAGNSTE